ncbi:MAG: NADPH:quinone oxidoreductase family protein, partial [Acidimicrobiales bacterium]|nr:NADPH:quinone oxidoreductase family protein [Acidimicrobiales bacterium]
CRGIYQGRTPIPFTPGTETAGTVLAVGDGVTHLAVGDRAAAMAGGLAEQVVVPGGMTWRIPDRLSMAQATAVPVNYGTSWFALHDRGHLRRGDVLLVTGAAGGAGSAAVQLGLAAGATVIAVAGGAEKVARCNELGAHHVIDHHRLGPNAGNDAGGDAPDLVSVVRDLTGGVGVDVAYDVVGGDVAHQVRRCMAWNGRLLIIGFVGGIPDLPANHILLKNYSVVGVHWGASLARDPGALGMQMANVFDLAERGDVAPLVYPPYAFADGALALQDLADRATWGKVVVEV